MKIIESLIPGSPAWQKSRSASKAPAMMGESQYQPRNDLLKRMATGIKEEVDVSTQARFDAGHATEATGREIAEDILCDGLSPVTGESDDGYLTASFDGLTFDGKVGFEHKLWNETLAAAVRAEELPEQYKIQMDQQILVGGLEYVLFMCSDGTREKCVSMEYRSTPERAAKLLAAWRQFDEDLANYKPVEISPVAVAATVEELPVLFIQAKGEITATNMPAFKQRVVEYVGELNMKPATDQEFADSKAIAKMMREAAVKVKERKADMLAQTVTMGEIAVECDHIIKLLNENALKLEKAVTAEEENRKLRLIARGTTEVAAHFAALNKRIAKVVMPPVKSDFAGAIKGKRNLESMEGAISTEIARVKLEANEIADKIDANLKTLADETEHQFLFADIATLAMKAPDDLALVIKSRIQDHTIAEEKRKAADREKIRVEEEAKATAKAKAEQDAADAQRKAAEEAAAKIERDRLRATQATPAPVLAEKSVADANARSFVDSISTTEPAAQAATVGVDLAAPGSDRTVYHSGGRSGRARLLDRLDEIARQLTERDLSDLVIHAAHVLDKQKAVAA